jgi:hypothetical protein
MLRTPTERWATFVSGKQTMRSSVVYHLAMFAIAACSADSGEDRDAGDKATGEVPGARRRVRAHGLGRYLRRRHARKTGPRGRQAVAALEADPMAFRYAWFTGRFPSSPPVNLLAPTSGQLTPLGQRYVTLPR